MKFSIDCVFDVDPETYNRFVDLHGMTFIIDDIDQVEQFLEGDERNTVTVLADDGRIPLTGEMTPAAWEEWKREHATSTSSETR